MKHIFFRPLLILSLSLSAWGGDFDHSHDAFTDLLRDHVRKGRVDYSALKESPEALRAYLDTLAAVSKDDFKSWNDERQIAFLINLYNAATLDLIVQHYPVESIKRIGGFSGPWKQKVVRLWGEMTTLHVVEHDVLREDYPDVPEIHFALVCAAEGCPNLRDEAYEGRELEEQLAEQRNAFLSDEKKNRVDLERKRIYLSPIFKWFADDFEETSGSVHAYVKDAAWPEVDDSFRIRYTRYSWSLNER